LVSVQVFANGIRLFKRLIVERVHYQVIVRQTSYGCTAGQSIGESVDEITVRNSTRTWQKIYVEATQYSNVRVRGRYMGWFHDEEISCIILEV